MRKFSLNSSQIYYYPLDEKREEKGILIYVSSYIAITWIVHNITLSLKHDVRTSQLLDLCII